MKHQSSPFNFAVAYSDKRIFPSIEVASVRSCRAIFLWEASSKPGLTGTQQTSKVETTIEKVHDYFQFYVYKRMMEPTFTFSYFLEHGFCLLLQNGCSHPHCVSTGLCIASEQTVENLKVITDILCGPFILTWVAKVQNTDKLSKFSALDLNCRFILLSIAYWNTPGPKRPSVRLRPFRDKQQDLLPTTTTTLIVCRRWSVILSGPLYSTTGKLPHFPWCTKFLMTKSS